MINSRLYLSFGMLLVIAFKQCLCQVCSRNVLEQLTFRKPYQITYREKYKDKCWYGSCTKTRIRSVIDYRILTKNEVREVAECCVGYIREDSEDLNSDATLICNPICTPPCINSTCSSPGVCACYVGYAESSPHSCTPVCSVPCHHGTCVAPETCHCDFGYKNSTGICEPICTEPCINGSCALPDTCECHTGFRKSENNVCRPYCSNGCTNGLCTSPETCECNEGFQHNGNNLCIPNCITDCGHGTCIAPHVCECEPGYAVLNVTCQPVCSNCVNGICVAPETCECNPGYISINSTCQPICNGCVNGKCIAPNTCECNKGYQASLTTCKPICGNCGGICTEIRNNYCVCDNDNDDNEDCEDCPSDCYAKDRKCTLTNCVAIPDSTTESTTEEANREDFNNLDTYTYYLTETVDSSIVSTGNYDTPENETIGDNQQRTKNNEFTVYWMYTSAIVIVVITLMMILILRRRSLGRYCRGGSYVVDESSKSSNDCRPSTSFDMRFSTIEKSAKERN